MVEGAVSAYTGEKREGVQQGAKERGAKKRLKGKRRYCWFWNVRE